MKLSEKIISEKNFIGYISDQKIENICGKIQVPKKDKIKRDAKRYVLATYIVRNAGSIRFVCSIGKYKSIDAVLDMIGIQLYKLEKIYHKQAVSKKNVTFIK